MNLDLCTFSSSLPLCSDTVWSLNVSAYVYTCHLNLSTSYYNLPQDKHRASRLCETLYEFSSSQAVKSFCHKIHGCMCGVFHQCVFSYVSAFCNEHWNPFRYEDTHAIDSCIRWLQSLCGIHWHVPQDHPETKSVHNSCPIYTGEVQVMLEIAEMPCHVGALTLFGLVGWLGLARKFAAGRSG